MTTEGYLRRQWTNDERTVLVTQYDDGSMEVAVREDAGDLWGPPVQVELEGVAE